MKEKYEGWVIYRGEKWTGKCVFFKKEKFELISKEDVFKDLTIGDKERRASFQFTQLKLKGTNNYLLCVNLHLKAKAPNKEIRCAEVTHLLE